MAVLSTSVVEYHPATYSIEPYYTRGSSSGRHIYVVEGDCLLRMEVCTCSMQRWRSHVSLT